DLGRHGGARRTLADLRLAVHAFCDVVRHGIEQGSAVGARRGNLPVPPRAPSTGPLRGQALRAGSTWNPTRICADKTKDFAKFQRIYDARSNFVNSSSDLGKRQ